MSTEMDVYESLRTADCALPYQRAGGGEIPNRAFDHSAHAPEDVELYARALAQPGNTRGGLEWYRAYPTDHTNALVWKRQLLTIPVLGLGGDHRYGPKIVAVMKEFATDVSGGSIANCAHWVPEERPGETGDAVLNFLAR